MRNAEVPVRRGDNIAKRLLAFSAEAVKIASSVSTDATRKHVSMQLLRAATGAAANYEEARSAESRQDFIHKVGIAAKEMRETAYWLNLVDATGLAPVGHLRREADELIAILVASARTARSRL
jgi:four helix bundle protein